MKNLLVKTIKTYLDKNKVRYNADYFKSTLLSHPDYPYLNSICETLTELNIGCLPVIVTINDLIKNDFPVLVYLEEGKGHFAIMEKIDKEYVYLMDYILYGKRIYPIILFNNMWKGVAVYVFSTS